MILYDENNNRLFYLIWRNKYLRRIILANCLLFKNHRKTRTFQNTSKLNNHRFWYYFTDIRLNRIDNKIKYPMFLETISFGVLVESISKEILKRMFIENKNLLNLKLPYSFNSNEIFDIISDMPNSITSIEFGRYFNQPLPTALSSNTNLKKITFCELFNQEIFNLPLGLTHLKFISYYYIKSSFSQHLNISFLKSLVYINLTSIFDNNFLVGCLDNGGALKTIKFGKRFNQMLTKGIIPDGVESVYITNEKYLIDHESIYLPDSVKYLKVAFYSDKLLSIKPNTLNTLAFSRKFKDNELHLKKFPNITRLEFGYHFGSILPELLPSSLKEIVLSNNHSSYNNLFKTRKYKIICPKYKQLY